MLLDEQGLYILVSFIATHSEHAVTVDCASGDRGLLPLTNRHGLSCQR